MDELGVPPSDWKPQVAPLPGCPAVSFWPLILRSIAPTPADAPGIWVCPDMGDDTPNPVTDPLVGSKSVSYN